MKLYILLSIIILLKCSSYSYGQSKNDLQNIREKDSLIRANLDFLRERDYISYSVGNSVVVVEGNKCVYFLTLKKGLFYSKNVPELSVNLFFSKKSMRFGKRYSNNDYISSCIGSYVYLSINKKGQKTSEFNLPFMLLCDEETKIVYPFKPKALDKLHQLYLEGLLLENR